MSAALRTYDNTNTPAARPLHGVATARQKLFIQDMLKKIAPMDTILLHGLEVQARVYARVTWSSLADLDRQGKFTKAQASSLIGTMKGILAAATSKQDVKPVVKPAARVLQTELPDGYYALRNDDKIDFIVLDRKTKTGNPRLRMVVGSQFVPVRYELATQIINQIEEIGAQTSGKLYASEIGCCYRCNRRLTTPESRELGLGPICAQA